MIEIKTLLGHAQVDTSCTCLGSLLKYCKDPIRLTIHDDGTLTPSDLDKLSHYLANPNFISREIADKKVLPLLEKFPACIKYREQNALGLKLFDVSLLQSSDSPLYFLDSDVLFFRPFRLPPQIEKNSAIFMQDSQQAFSLLPWDIKPFGSIEAIGKVNTGFITIWAENVDLNYIESILSNPRLSNSTFQKRRQWVEQTCWAALATQLSSTYLLNSNQVSIAAENMGAVTSDLVATHFVSTYRGKLKSYLDYQPEDLDAECILQVQKAGNVSALDILTTEISRRVKWK